MNHLDAYARSVVAGAIPAGKYHRLSCVRHLRDRERENTAGFPYRLDLDRAERFFRFAAKLKHYKGKQWAGQFIELQPQQRFRLGSIFAWVHVATSLRRFRTAYNEIPRKNGKSLEAAIVAVYVSFFDGEEGAEGYTIATKRDQAKIVFNDAKKLVETSGLKTRIDVRVAELRRESNASKLLPLGADADSTDGLNPSLIVIDEFHKHKTRDLIDVMETATGQRVEPLNFQITTAGDNPVSPCGDQHDYACKILDGLIDDETFFAFIAHADPADDWMSETTWAKANPNWSVMAQDDMRNLCRKAKNMPGAAATFKQKRLNLWVSASQPWLSPEGWRTGQHQDWTPEDLRGKTCYVGIDLASKLDLCAMVFVFPPTEPRLTWRLLLWAWTPADTLRDRAHRDRAPYEVWAEQGHLLLSPGATIDHELVRQVIVAERERFQIAQIGFDPWHAGTIIDRLKSEDGFTDDQVIEVPQTFKGMSDASLQFEAMVVDGKVDAHGSPLFAWCASNAVVQRDGKDNIQPIKKKSRGRIDPVVAAVIGFSLAIRQSDPVAEDPVLVTA